MSIRDLFNKTTTAFEGGTMPNAPITSNPNNRQDGETYRHWGLRVCAVASGSIYALNSYLHNVYNNIRNEQLHNQHLQDELRRNLECEIEQKRIEIEDLNTQLTNNKNKQSDYKNEIERLENEKTDIRNRNYEVNKEAKIKLILGLLILVPLTFYLFLFYSSTFYSAFFKQFGADDGIMNAMFDPQAWNNAWQEGIMEFLFCLFAPIIFLGLGFILHFFTIQESWTKYLKMISIICITFIFDAILAYLIGKHIHDMEVITGIRPIGSTYGFSEAISDINTWAVIFCGFIVYIIWGIVFDMALTAYNRLDLNQENIKAIEKRICIINKDIKNEENNVANIQSKITDKRKEQTKLTSKIANRELTDDAAIKNEMHNFFAGWVAQMSVLGMGHDDQEQANKTFENTLNSLFT